MPLDQDLYLNDNLIDFFTEVVSQENIYQDVKIFNSFTLKCIAGGSMVRSRKLTSSIKLAIFPYNFEDKHWVLIVVEVRRKEILCLDFIPLMSKEEL